MHLPPKALKTATLRLSLYRAGPTETVADVNVKAREGVNLRSSTALIHLAVLLNAIINKHRRWTKMVWKTRFLLTVFAARRYAQRGLCHRAISVCLPVRQVCVLYLNE